MKTFISMWEPDDDDDDDDDEQKSSTEEFSDLVDSAIFGHCEDEDED